MASISLQKKVTIVRPKELVVTLELIWPEDSRTNNEKNDENCTEEELSKDQKIDLHMLFFFK